MKRIVTRRECLCRMTPLIIGGIAVKNSAFRGVLWAAEPEADRRKLTGDANLSPVRLSTKDLSSWRQPSGEWMPAAAVYLNSKDPTRFSTLPIEDARAGLTILVNGWNGKTVNLLSKLEHGDAEIHVEFVIPKGSNSGVYLQGRYEIQILDSWGVKEPKYGDCGGIYQRWKDNKGFEGHPPRVNASRPPGEWQSFDIIFRAPRFDVSGKKIRNAKFVRVSHNGKVIHENVEVTGPTRAAAFEDDEKPTGPLMLQGDHGPVALRNFEIKTKITE